MSATVDPLIHQPNVVRKVAWRLIPVLMVCYFTAFLDRVNIGFAALTMSNDLGFTPAIFGVGAGLFFLGYVICEVPSNLIMTRVGARLWIGRIMISWGILSALTALVTGERSFYLVRALLGTAEAGFFPCMVFYLSQWFPRAERARMLALFIVAIPMSSVIGAPVSAMIMDHFDRINGLAGWQWLFLLEALPAIVMGVVALMLLPDSPDRASWLSESEARWLTETMAHEQNMLEAREHLSVLRALTDWRVLLMCVINLGIVIGTTGAAIWMPQIVRAFGLTTIQTGFVTAIPSIAMAIAMVVGSRHADRTGERVWHVAAPFLFSVAGFLLAAFASTPVVSLIGLTIGAAGIGGAAPNFWLLPTTLLTSAAAAAGIALINSAGSAGGFFGPAVIGWIRELTGKFSGSLIFLAIVCAISAVVTLLLGSTMRDQLKPGVGETGGRTP